MLIRLAPIQDRFSHFDFSIGEKTFTLSRKVNQFKVDDDGMGFSGAIVDSDGQTWDTFDIKVTKHKKKDRYSFVYTSTKHHGESHPQTASSYEMKGVTIQTIQGHLWMNCEYILGIIC